ncbi:recombinase family protein [Fictibacillus sp. B-59209]|uniref:recombinase family protein n=1 Tax=Fictibacillus sp. B-59209 TaxID=3024873 RepID=UPI002E1D2F54|nr:recombinase family protein [Fictibacillus sp. B-59209]
MGMITRTKAGLWNGGSILGYKSENKKLIIIPEEAHIVKIIFQKCVNNGWGIKKITNFLNKMGYLSKKRKPFSIGAVSTILKNPIYKGYLRYNQVTNWERDRRKGTNPNPIIVQGIHKSIINVDTWKRHSNY